MNTVSPDETFAMKLFATVLTAFASSVALAQAADLPSRTAPPVFVAPAVAPYSWTGFEAGLHSAYTFGTDNRVSTSANNAGVAPQIAPNKRPATLDTPKSGFSNVGAGIGYNYQFTPGSGIVVGVGADADWVDLHKNAYNLTDRLSVYHQRLDWLGTANGRLGYAFDRLLVYGTGGFAFGDPGYGGTFYGTVGGLRNYGGNNGSLKGGYDFGGGLAYAIPDTSFLNAFAVEKLIGLDRLIGAKLTTTLKIEYVHYDLGTESIVLRGITPADGSYTLRYRTEGNQVRAGLIYSFAGAPAVPVVARY